MKREVIDYDKQEREIAKGGGIVRITRVIPEEEFKGIKHNWRQYKVILESGYKFYVWQDKDKPVHEVGKVMLKYVNHIQSKRLDKPQLGE